MNPTRYFVLRDQDGPISGVARWFWPESTEVEVYDGVTGDWVAAPIFLSLHDDPEWEFADRSVVEHWVHQVKARQASEVPTEPSDTTGQSAAG